MSEIVVYDCEQYSPEWWACRMGLPTASQFATVQARGRSKGEESVTRRRYLNTLAAERYSGQICEEANYSNTAMERGHALEEEAAELYATTQGCELERVGFYRHDGHRAGCSPDRKIVGGGLLSVKTAFPHIITDFIRRDRFPSEHRAQSQGELWITGEPFLDLVVYWPGMPLFVKRCEPDPHYIMELAEAIKIFNAECDAAVETLRRYRGPSTLKEDLRGSIIAHDELMRQAQEPPKWD